MCYVPQSLHLSTFQFLSAAFKHLIAGLNISDSCKETYPWVFIFLILPPTDDFEERASSVSTFIGFASFDSFQCPPSSRLLGHICHAMFSGHGLFVEGHVIAKDQQLVGLLNVGPMI